MKKLLGITIAMMLGISMIGCESTDENNAKEEKPEVKQEEQIEEKETKEVVNETESEEEVENKVLTFDDEEFKHYMTTNLSDEEYDKYFDSITWTKDGNLTEIEFDGCILEANVREGYDTRFELLMMTGDYSENEMNGPYIKVKDIGGTQLKGLTLIKNPSVKVKGKIHGYDIDRGYLEISINEIEAR